MGRDSQTIDAILESLHDASKEDEDADIQVWEKRAQIYRRAPKLLGEPIAALNLLERLRREATDSHDLFFLDEAMADVAQTWPESEREVIRRRSRFFDHMSPPPPELFDSIETPLDGEIKLWREIPAGSFLMGSPDCEPKEDDEDLGAWDDERPQHPVQISRPFRMMATPVTNRQFRSFDTTHESDNWKAELDWLPVVKVSWYQASIFCRWLERGLLPGARLPTEAEWEYSCRAGTATRFWSGEEETDLERTGWYRKNSNDSTRPAGSKPANPWGLYDMHGNVWEWCRDHWDDEDYSARAQARPIVDPLQERDVWQTDTLRVCRGGSWANRARGLRAAHRDRSWSRRRYGNVGLRVVCSTAGRQEGQTRSS